jgi:hypothetical protein
VIQWLPNNMVERTDLERPAAQPDRWADKTATAAGLQVLEEAVVRSVRADPGPGDLVIVKQPKNPSGALSTVMRP